MHSKRTKGNKSCGKKRTAPARPRRSSGSRRAPARSRGY